ncbi:MAG: GerW family sporulation protein [Clostridia bacterium]|nr:GerW family sporulation protein [Clostridia bacterium]
MSHPIENIMHSSMERIKELADVNTVIGTPIMADDNTMILPVSKVSLGMLVGGGEYNASQPMKRCSQDIAIDTGYPFIGASTLGMSLTPLAFLAVSNGSVRVLPAKQECSADRLIEMVPQIVETAERIIGEYLSPERETKRKSRVTGISINELNRRAAEETAARYPLGTQTEDPCE